MNADAINGAYEILGGFFILLSCRKLYIDKYVAGISWLQIAFYTTWGWWNLIFYPSVDAWISFYGGIGVAFANITWLSMMIYYTYWSKK